MLKRNKPAAFCLIVMCLLIGFWLVEHLVYWYEIGMMPTVTCPDSCWFARLVEQSLLRGKILKTDTYACYPYEMRVPFGPFHLGFLYHFTNFVYALWPNCPYQPDVFYGSVPILITFLTAFFILFTLWYLKYPVSVLLFCAVCMLPNGAVMAVSGFMMLDTDFWVSFCVWAWLLFAMLHVDTGRQVFNLGGAVVSVLFIAVWTGTPLFYFLVVLYSLFLFAAKKSFAAAFFDYASSSMLIGGVLNLLYIFKFHCPAQAFSHGVYSYFQPLCAVLGGAFVCILKVLALKNSSRIKAFLYFFIGLAFIGVTFKDNLYQAYLIMSNEDPLYETITELKPMFKLSHLITKGNTYGSLLNAGGGAVFMFTLFVFICTKMALANKSAVILRDWLLIMLALAFNQIRYIRWVGFGTGIYAGFIIAFLFKSCAAYLKNDKRKWLKLVVAFVPIIAVNNFYNLPEVLVAPQHSKYQIEIFNWIKTHTPETSGYTDNKKPEYSILPFWDEGNYISYYAHRPTVTNNGMWGYSTMASIFSSETEDEAYELCKKFDIRYIFVSSRAHPKSSTAWWHYFKNKPLGREYSLVGKNVSFDDNFENWFIFWLRDKMGINRLAKFGAASHFRCLYASKTPNAYTAPKFTLYEVLKGAVINIKAKPESEASISLGMTANETVIFYKKIAKADKNGHVQFVVPYSTSYYGGRIKTDEFYKIAFINKDTGKRVKAMAVVSDKQVLNGDNADLQIAD